MPTTSSVSVNGRLNGALHDQIAFCYVNTALEQTFNRKTFNFRVPSTTRVATIGIVFDAEFIAAFEEHIDREGSCHHWTGSTSNGLPVFRGRTAARVAWQLAHGHAVPPGRHVRRRCSAPLCVRADHLTIDPVEHVKRPSKKLSRLLADDVRVRHAAGASTAQLAENYGITRQHVHKIIKGQAWTGGGVRKPRSGSVPIVSVEVGDDGVQMDRLACGHAVRSVNWPNKWRRCPECSP